MTTYHDIDKSRSLPWDRRPEASRILMDLKNPNRGWDALVIAEPQRAFSGTQFEGILFQFAHYGVSLWVPELGGPVDIDNDGHYMALSNYGTMSRAERNRTRLRVANAVRAHAQAGRWLGGRPPYGYRIADRGPHPNPSKAASGARLHQLEPDPETSPVVQRIYAMYLAGAGYKQIATVLTNEGVPSPSSTTVPGTPTGLAMHGRCQRCEASWPTPDTSATTSRAARRRPMSCSTPIANARSHHPTATTGTRHMGYCLDTDLRGHRGEEDLAPGASAHRRQHPLERQDVDSTQESSRRAAIEISRYPLAGLVICDACGRKLQGNMVRGHAFYRCKLSRDYPVSLDNHPLSLAVREDRLLPHVDHWLCELFAPDRVEATAAEVVQADAEGQREDADIVRARLTLGRVRTQAGQTSRRARGRNPRRGHCSSNRSRPTREGYRRGRAGDSAANPETPRIR